MPWVSLRLIIYLITMLKNNENIKLYLRDVVQLYMQSTSNLNHESYIRLSPKLILLFDDSCNCIIKVIKSLYFIAKAGNSLFATYYPHHKEKCKMRESSYNLYLLYNFGPFGIVGIQTDDILILADNNFASVEENAIKLAK